MHRRENLIRTALTALHYTGADRLLAPLFRGIGVIFTLHHVRPAREDAFQPNGHLEVTPEFLRQTLQYLTGNGYDLVTMDEVEHRLQTHEFRKPFACFTFDDGYRDNRDYALPIMREFNAPMIVYATSDFSRDEGLIWWVALERIVAAKELIEVTIDGEHRKLATRSTLEKHRAFQQILVWLRSLPNDQAIAREVRLMAQVNGAAVEGMSRELCMQFDELADFAKDPLVSIGAHTVSHANLAHLSYDEAQHEMLANREELAKRLSVPIDHFAFPYGHKSAAWTREYALAKEVGFKTAVTTRPGMLHGGDKKNTSHLCRISLNGKFQQVHFLPVLLSGFASATWAGLDNITNYVESRLR